MACRALRDVVAGALVTVSIGTVAMGIGATVTGASIAPPDAPLAEIAPAAEPTSFPAPHLDDATRLQLEELGYVDTRRARSPELRGVVVPPRARSSAGLDLYCSRDRASAVLADRHGAVVHRWSAAEGDLAGGSRRTWMHVEPLPSGDLLAITKDHDLTRIDARSRVIWRARLRAHHDLAIAPDGRILVLTRGARRAVVRGASVPVLADSISILDADGALVERVELLPLVSDLAARRLARARAAHDDGATFAELVRAGGVGDVLHTNSIAILEREIPGIAPAGSVLLSFRAPSRIAVLSPDLSRVLFHWGRGELQQQHDATQLASGNLMIFDNGFARRRSRVIEVDPTTGEIVWQYAPDDLWSPIRGGAQALPTGNVLVTESEAGHALEVTREGAIVWEMWNPDVRGGERPRRAVIYRVNRFPESFFDPALGWRAER